MIIELVHKIIVHPGMKAFEDGGQIVEEHSDGKSLKDWANIFWKSWKRATKGKEKGRGKMRRKRADFEERKFHRLRRGEGWTAPKKGPRMAIALEDILCAASHGRLKYETFGAEKGGGGQSGFPFGSPHIHILSPMPSSLSMGLSSAPLNAPISWKEGALALGF
jgi:hypothetical protein